MSIHTVVTFSRSVLKLCERFHHPVTGKKEEAVLAYFAELPVYNHPLSTKRPTLFFFFLVYDVCCLKGTLPESLFSLLKLIIPHM